MITMEPLAVSLDEAIALLGVEPEFFQQQYIATRRIEPIQCGSRLLVCVEELRWAFRDYILETQEGDPAPSRRATLHVIRTDTKR